MPLSPEPDLQANAGAKPRLAFRVGVTGTLDLLPDRLGDLSAQVSAVLQRIRNEIAALADHPALAQYYAREGSGLQPPLLRIISPLARGADRLVAKEALALGYALNVPMPFSLEEYERDFKPPNTPPTAVPEDLKEFRELFARAGDNWIALDGNRDTADDAYEAAGEFVVRNSDIVIAIWDGGKGNGRGGTRDIVHFAARAGVPVWWIHATQAIEPQWIADIQDLRDPLITAKPEDRLHAFLWQRIPPPKPILRERHSWLSALAFRPGAADDPAGDYFAESPLPSHGVWKLYGRMMLFASGCWPPWTPPVKPQNEPGAYWFQFYAPADARAGEYATRYRSSYVWVFLLATCSLLFGALASMFHGREVVLFSILGFGVTGRSVVILFAMAELVALVAILIIALMALRDDWHVRSIEYRLLAELCRKQQVLAPLGRALSFGAVQQLAALMRDAEAVSSEPGGASPSELAAEGDRSGWVSWLFMAYQRAALMPRGTIAHLFLLGVRNQDVLHDLVKEQLEYHSGRAKMAGGAAKFFEHNGERIFGIVLFCVFFKIILTLLAGSPLTPLDDWVTASLGLLGVILPALSAAAVGIGSYAEWQLLAEESNHMLELLKLAKQRIDRINLKRPLASQDLGAEADAVASLMLQDLEGWQRLFRVKIIETQ
jgi:hypothetical protein